MHRILPAIGDNNFVNRPYFKQCWYLVRTSKKTNLALYQYSMNSTGTDFYEDQSSFNKPVLAFFDMSI